MVAVSDTLFAYTRNGLKRPSDIDGLEVLCDDGNYHLCHVTPKKLTNYWTLFFSNGMVMEIEDGCALKGVDGYIADDSLVVDTNLYTDNIYFWEHDYTYELNLSDVTLRKSGTIDLFTDEMAIISGLYCTSGLTNKSGDVGMRNRNTRHAVIMDAFKKVGVQGSYGKYTYNLKKSWITDLLEACYGKAFRGSKERHYIPDDILLTCPPNWASKFIYTAMGCYALTYINMGSYRGYYNSFMTNSHKFVNDLAHLIQKSESDNYEFRLFNNGTYYDDFSFKAQPVKYKKQSNVQVVQGLRFNVPTIGYDIKLEESKELGIYMSGFYIK